MLGVSRMSQFYDAFSDFIIMKQYENCGIAVRVNSALSDYLGVRHNELTVEQVLSIQRQKFSRIRNMGSKSIAILCDFIDDYKGLKKEEEKKSEAISLHDKLAELLDREFHYCIHTMDCGDYEMHEKSLANTLKIIELLKDK